MYAYYASNKGWHRQLFEVWLFTVHLIVYSHNGMGFLGGKATDFRVVVFLVGVIHRGFRAEILSFFSGKSSVKPWSFLDFCSGMDWLAGFFSINQRQELEEEPLMEGILHQLKYGEYPQLKYEEYPIFHRVSLDNRWCRKPPSIDSMTQLHFANAAHHVLLSCYDARFGDATLRGTILGLSVHYYGYGPDAQLGNIGRTVADHQQEVL